MLIIENAFSNAILKAFKETWLLDGAKQSCVLTGLAVKKFENN